jgi:hypothetical protein
MLTLQRRDAVDAYRESIEQAAREDANYRLAWAKAIVSAEGTAQAREAYAEEHTNDLRVVRDIANGLVKVHKEKLDGLEGERSLLKSLVDWSARMEGTSS